MQRRRCLPLALALALLVAAPAAAEPEKGPEDTELAKRYYKLGEELFWRADYEKAMGQFQQAYALSKKPALLFNIARCHESLGEHEKAIEVYEEYLQSKPDNAALVRTRVANLRRLLKKRQQESKEPAQSKDPNGGKEPKGGKKPAGDKEPAGGKAPKDGAEPGQGSLGPVISPQPPDGGGSRPLRTAGWVTLGAGAAVAVAGLAMGIVSSQKASDLEEASAAGQEWAAVEGDADLGKGLQTGAIVGLAVGGAALVTGAVLLFLDARRQPDERSAWLAPVPLARGGGLAGGVTF